MDDAMTDDKRRGRRAVRWSGNSQIWVERGEERDEEREYYNSESIRGTGSG
jgi:hypothetical protein